MSTQTNSKTSLRGLLRTRPRKNGKRPSTIGMDGRERKGSASDPGAADGVREPWRDITYAEIADSIRARKCPVCVLREKALYRHFFPILYELTNDPGVRRDLRERRGFCPRHTWDFHDVSENDPLLFAVPVAIIYEDLLLRELESIGSRKPPHAERSCSACAEERGINETIIPKIRRLLVEPRFRKEWDESGPLCLPHFWRILEGQDEAPWRSYLVRKQQKELRALLDSLHEYLRTQDYLHAHERRRSDEDAWIRALEMAVGSRFTGKEDLHPLVKP